MPLNKKDGEKWVKKLTPEQYNVCRLGSTEPAFSGKYYKHTGKGTYVCVACGKMLFSSDSKFDSGTGWPSFWDAAGKVDFRDDYSFGLHRIGVRCSNCHSHLGHIFDDGPNPTGKRYCINSLALDFRPEKNK